VVVGVRKAGRREELSQSEGPIAVFVFTGDGGFGKESDRVGFCL
jgi:hypothetical protein